MLQLTPENYYSDEANQQYMSYSQYKSFLPQYGGCEAMAMAKLWGGWQEPESEALLLGSYVHAWSEGTLDKFKDEHEDLFSTRGETKGQLLAKHKIADTMIETLQADEWCMEALSGEKEEILTAEFAGCMWKIKVDVLNVEAGRLVDLKTCRSLSERVYSEQDRYYKHWIEAYGYIGQMAAYTEIEKRASGRENRLSPLIVAVSKEEVPDKAIVFFNDNELDYELEMIEFNMPHILEVKNRIIKPVRCEKCRYCRETKKVSKIVHFSEL
jgi:hypothetical protein